VPVLLAVLLAVFGGIARAGGSVGPEEVFLKRIMQKMN
jgi:hypothetical protein